MNYFDSSTPAKVHIFQDKNKLNITKIILYLNERFAVNLNIFETIVNETF